MADKGYLRALVSGLDGARQLYQAFEHVVDVFKFGAPTHQRRALNGQFYWLTSTSATASTTEFSIQHGLATAPVFGIPVLNFSHVGSKAGGLTVSRVADSRRVYLKADSTNAPVWILVE